MRSAREPAAKPRFRRWPVSYTARWPRASGSCRAAAKGSPALRVLKKCGLTTLQNAAIDASRAHGRSAPIPILGSQIGRGTRRLPATRCRRRSAPEEHRRDKSPVDGRAVLDASTPSLCRRSASSRLNRAGGIWVEGGGLRLPAIVLDAGTIRLNLHEGGAAGEGRSERRVRLSLDVEIDEIDR